jgi:hypothetical protein
MTYYETYDDIADFQIMLAVQKAIDENGGNRDLGTHNIAAFTGVRTIIKLSVLSTNMGTVRK